MSPEASTIGGDQTVEDLRRELAEGREQQAVTAEILRVIASSPMDLQVVFAAITASAARLCDAYDAAIHRVDGYFLPAVAHHGPIPVPSMLPLRAGFFVGRAVLDQRTIHISDVQKAADEYPEGSDRAKGLGFRTILAVPLIRAGKAIGVISIRRVDVRAFTDRQVELLKTFADQAVIALENARLFEAEQARMRELSERTQELTETLAYQTASSEILRVISSSPTDIQPTFDAIAISARRLCEAAHGMVFRFDGELIHLVAHDNLDAEQLAAVRSVFPIPPGRGSITARAILTRTLVHVQDRRQDSELDHIILSANFPTTLSVPLLRDGVALGAITVTRAEVALFSDRQVDLLKTFADQAVIAIENTRLFEEVQARTRELTESLEQQTATSEVLSVISSSPDKITPVFTAILMSATRICTASYGIMFLCEEDALRTVAIHGALPAAYAEQWRAGTLLRPDPELPACRAVKTRQPVQTADMRAASAYRTGDPLAVSAVETAGIRTVLAVPMIKDNKAIGAIAIYRKEVLSFTDRQIDLVTNFASQAVIAIENTRLLNELRESLQQQTATADVLKVISRSALDLQRVLDALVESAARLCDANDAAIFQVFGDSLRLVADHRQTFPMAGSVGQLTLSLVRGRIIGRAVIDRRTIQVADALAEADEYPESWKIAQQYGHRTMLAVPLVHAGEAIGVIYIRRAEVRPFTERQIELVNTFADQAVIAIENTRLFEEVQARTHELAKTVEDLEIASQHKNQFVANMSHELRTPLAAILGYAELIQEGFYEPQGPKSLDALTRIRSNGKHLLGLINTVLDIAKIESGQFTLNMTEYAIESVIETVRAATEALAQNKKLSLKTEVAKSLPIGLGDEQRLTQVLLNLVGNAIKFTDTGEVCVIAKAINGQFNVSVTDTGPGIPTEHQTRIFEQFHQVDSSNTKAKGGTGLGLAIAKQIVEMHGGRIWVESALGRGSTFQMEIPMSAASR
jgi:signal transduction histidine kinase